MFILKIAWNFYWLAATFLGNLSEFELKVNFYGNINIHVHL